MKKLLSLVVLLFVATNIYAQKPLTFLGINIIDDVHAVKEQFEAKGFKHIFKTGYSLE